jgi:hypothetical protein
MNIIELFRFLKSEIFPLWNKLKYFYKIVIGLLLVVGSCMYFLFVNPNCNCKFIQYLNRKFDTDHCVIYCKSNGYVSIKYYIDDRIVSTNQNIETTETINYKAKVYNDSNLYYGLFIANFDEQDSLISYGCLFDKFQNGAYQLTNEEDSGHFTIGINDSSKVKKIIISCIFSKCNFSYNDDIKPAYEQYYNPIGIKGGYIQDCIFKLSLDSTFSQSNNQCFIINR